MKKLLIFSFIIASIFGVSYFVEAKLNNPISSQTLSSKFDEKLIATSTWEGNLTIDGQLSINIAPDDAHAITVPNTGSDTGGNQTGYGIAKGWTVYSDDRIKSNEVDLNYGLIEVMQLSPKRYVQHDSEFIDGELVLDKGNETIGLIAQEVFGVIPEAVGKPNNEDESLWNMQYTKLIPVIIKGIQELASMVYDIDDRVTLLEGNPIIANQSGRLIVLSNTDSTDVVFDQQYTLKPLVVSVANSNLYGNNYWISNRTRVGFKLNISSTLNEDISFDWVAIEKK